MNTLRRLRGGTLAALLVMAGAIPAWAESADSGGPVAAHGGAAGDNDAAAAFESFEVQAQSQAAAGYLFAVGDEENRLAGARVGVAKPPDVYALAAAFQRGLAAGYFYAAVLGSSAAGGAGVAPEPPPGETRGLYPSEPRESTWEGPVTAGANGPVVDGRSEAKATAVPTGDATLELQGVTVPGQLTIEGGRISSRGAPVATGIEGEAISVLSGVTIGSDLRIETLTSRAHGLVPADGADPVGTASTVVEGASVNGTPVRITHDGLELGDQAPAAAPKAQLLEQVRQSLAANNIEDVRLGEASASPQTDGVRVTAGVLRVIYRNPTFGASNPQGFSGGGFEIGGATVSVTASRALPVSAPAAVPAGAAPAPGEESGPDPTVAPATAASWPTPRAPSPSLAATVPAETPATPLENTRLSRSTATTAVERDSQEILASVQDARAPALTRLFPAALTEPTEADRNTARWTGVAFLLLGSIPLWVVLTFRLARPTAPPTVPRKGS